MANSPPSPSSKGEQQLNNHLGVDNNKPNDPPQISQNNKTNNKKRGVAGFSIDDILSHKTAQLKEQQEQQREQQIVHVPQAIVRPWDIGVAGGNPTAAAVLAAQQHQLKQQQLKQQQQKNGDSPLDALFQMASKTFEGLKAKSGRIFCSSECAK